MDALLKLENKPTTLESALDGQLAMLNMALDNITSAAPTATTRLRPTASSARLEARTVNGCRPDQTRCESDGRFGPVPLLLRIVPYQHPLVLNESVGKDLRDGLPSWQWTAGNLAEVE